jgi:hypothetical protein
MAIIGMEKIITTVMIPNIMVPPLFLYLLYGEYNGCGGVISKFTISFSL